MGTLTTSNSKPKSDERFPFLISLFRIGGLPLGTSEVFIMQKMYNRIISVCSYLSFLTIIFDAMFRATEDLKTALPSIRIAFFMAMYFWEEFILRIKRKTLNDLFIHIDKFTWEEIPETDIITGELTVVGWMSRMPKYIKINRNFLLVLILFLSMVKVFTSHELLLQSSFPFDVFFSPVYEIVLLTQLLSIPRIICLFYGIPYLYSILMCVGCTQLQKIQIWLLRIKQNHNLRGDKSQEEEKKWMENELSSCVKLHQQVLSYFSTIENATSTMMCGIFFFLLLSVCISAFAAVANLDDISESSQSLCLYVSTILVMSMYCIFATKLYEEYDEVRNAAWSSDWIGAPISYQRSIAVIMTMANKDITFTAGKAVPVSNSTLISMMNESMSLFMFLLTMKDKIQ